MRVRCYLRKGIVYIPTLAAVESNSGYRAIEPVAVVSVADGPGLRRALADAMDRGNPVVPILARGSEPPAILPKYAGVKSWSAFARGASTWLMEERDGVCQILGYRERPDRGWEEDPDQLTRLPPGSTINDLCNRMIEILQEVART